MRKAHRWLSLAFTLGFVINAAVILGLGRNHPPGWIYLLVLIPLFLLLPTGLYLFVLPSLGPSRRGSGVWAQRGARGGRGAS